MKTSLWLDLEGTVINNWDDALFTAYIPKIRRFIKSKPNDVEINIFSHAIYDDSDVNTFINSGMKDSIESSLKVDIKCYPSVEQIMNSIYKFDKIKYDSVHEFITLNGKFFSFIKFCRSLPKPDIKTCYYLIDDCVEDSLLEFHTQNKQIVCINVNSL